MAKEELSAREKALLAEARREAAAHKDARPLGQDPAAPQATPAPTQAERLAQLMAGERADTRRRKIRMRRYGLAIAGGIGVLFILWLLRAFRPRR